MTDSDSFVLIVDDQWQLASNLARFVTKLGLNARAASSVTAASRLISEQAPSVALIDLRLPDHDGTELCRLLRQRSPQTRVCVMSAQINSADHARLSALGVRDFLTKPFSLSSLAALLLANRPLPGSVLQPSHTITPPKAAQRQDRPRIALYSHDTMGLGHMRRDILIARTLAAEPLNASVLLISGAREVGRFDLPPGIDCLVLPSYLKSSHGTYESKHLDMQTRELVNLRSDSICASLTAFKPDVLVVDNVPRGALNELDKTLAWLNARGHTRCVLGLRDILDAPHVSRKEWEKRRNLPTIAWQYEQVWVYGDEKIYDFCREYDFGEEFNRKVRYTGYLDARKRAVPRDSEISSPRAQSDQQIQQPYNLCMVGGGQDGFELARAFAAARQPDGTHGILITGPFMQREQTDVLFALAETNPALTIMGFVQEPTRLLANARRVVAMGGYNTVNEVLAFRRPTLIVPRIKPREEQLVRAARLEALGYTAMLHPDDLNEHAISHWLDLADGAMPACHTPLELNGLDHLVRYVDALMTMEKTA